jgi:hypothetical protein
MRIFFLALFTILGANLMIDILDSNMIELLEERKDSIENIMQ